MHGLVVMMSQSHVGGPTPLQDLNYKKEEEEMPKTPPCLYVTASLGKRNWYPF
jgi:hypothetical protein